METLFTTYYQSPIGRLRISGTERCIIELKFDDDASPSKEVKPNELLMRCTEQLIQYFNGALRNFDLPVEQDGTAFQKMVWNELIGIPYGRTISYIELSRRLGDPKSVRACGTANGKNKIAIIVPCHRVVGANGSLVGYAGGLARKKFLLQHEAKIAHGVQQLF